jgi:hypothetical protein
MYIAATSSCVLALEDVALAVAENTYDADEAEVNDYGLRRRLPPTAGGGHGRGGRRERPSQVCSSAEGCTPVSLTGLAPFGALTLDPGHTRHWILRI